MSSSFQIPDFTKLLPASFELRVNQHCRVASDASLAWSQSEGLLLQPSRPITEQDDEQLVNSSPGLQTGLLAALCFPTCDFTQLRMAVDLLTLIVHWCDNAEQVDSPVSDRVFESLRTRLRSSTGPSWQYRFSDAFSAFRASRMNLPRCIQENQSLDECLSLKEDAEGLRLMFTLVEYCEGLHLSDDLYNHQILKDLRASALDTVVWIKDIASYNIQQAAGDSFNLVALIMNQRKVSVQVAVHAAIEAIRERLDIFFKLQVDKSLANMGKDVLAYVQGLRQCIIGWAYWVYETDRYFAENSEDVKEFGWVFLLPQTKGADSSNVDDN